MKLSPDMWAAAVPTGMRALPQWVVHHAKKPFHPVSGTSARVNDPSTWGTFEEAQAALPRYDGAGFVFTENTGLVFVDFDHVLSYLQPGVVLAEGELRELLDAAARETYTEVSPSGTGVHAFYIGKLPEGVVHCREFGPMAIEVYDRVRYSTVTGVRYGNAPLAVHPFAIERLVKFMGMHEQTAPEEPEPERAEEIAEALTHLDPDMPYPDWLRVGMALRAGLGDGVGRALWVGWSRDGAKWSPGEPEEKWRSFTGSGTGLGTIIWMAEQAGWQHGSAGPRAEDIFSALPGPPPDGESPFELLRADEVSIEPIHWLWPGRIARGHVALIMGDPKAGKTLMVEALAALRSRGQPLPGDSGSTIGRRWVLLESEDDENDTTAPRLVANGAEMSMVTILKRATSRLLLTNPRHLEHLEYKLQELGDVEALVISPLNNFMPGSAKVDGNKDQDIRSVLMPLVKLAKRLNIAVIVIHHLNKNTGANVLYRALGSIGMVGVARTILMVARNGDLRYVAVVGSNSREAPTLAFDIKSSERDENIGVLEWLDEDENMSAEVLCGPGSSRGARRAGAEEWLRVRLSAGPIPSLELFAEGQRAGFSQRTLERVREQAGVRVFRNGAGWVWSVSPGSQESPAHG